MKGLKFISISAQIVGCLLTVLGMYLLAFTQYSRLGLLTLVMSFGYMSLWIMADNVNKDYSIKSMSAFISATIAVVLAVIALFILS